MRQALTKQMLAVVLLLVSLPACSSGPNWVEIELRVHDHHDKPVPGAQVRGRFYVDQQLVDTDRESHTAVTDKQGRAQIAGKEHRHVPITVEKPGYYATKRDVVVTQKKRHSIDVLLRGKRQPVPLFAKTFIGEIPEAKGKIGFDFKKGDWVKPHGSGMVADVYFYFSGKVEGKWNYEATLNVIAARENDGVVRVDCKCGRNSELHLPYKAPKAGYRNSIELTFMRRRGEDKHKVKSYISDKDGRGYFFRTRTKKKKGKIVKANYAKVDGEIVFGINKKTGEPGRLEMTYYYNPTPNDRNLEFAVGANLFKNLPEEAQVHEP